MKPVRSLSLGIWLPLLVSVMFVSLWSITTWKIYRDSNSDLIDSSLNFVTDDMASLQREMNKAFSTGDYISAKQALSASGVDTRYTIIAAIDDQGRILQATRFALKNHLAGEALPDFDPRYLSRLQWDKRAHVHLVPDRQQIIADFPLTLGRQIDEIRPMSTGELFAVYDLSIDHARIWSHLWRSSLSTWLLLLIAVALSIEFLRQFVTRPIKHLAVSARAFANGESGAVSRIKGHGELFQLGEVFNEMSTQIGNRLEQLKRTEKKFRKSEASLANAQRIAHLGSWEWNIADNSTEWSDELYRIFGYQPGAFEPT